MRILRELGESVVGSVASVVTPVNLTVKNAFSQVQHTLSPTELFDRVYGLFDRDILVKPLERDGSVGNLQRGVVDDMKFIMNGVVRSLQRGVGQKAADVRQKLAVLEEKFQEMYVNSGLPLQPSLMLVLSWGLEVLSSGLKRSISFMTWFTNMWHLLLFPVVGMLLVFVVVFMSFTAEPRTDSITLLDSTQLDIAKRQLLLWRHESNLALVKYWIHFYQMHSGSAIEKDSIQLAIAESSPLFTAGDETPKDSISLHVDDGIDDGDGIYGDVPLFQDINVVTHNQARQDINIMPYPELLPTKRFVPSRHSRWSLLQSDNFFRARSIEYILHPETLLDGIRYMSNEDHQQKYREFVRLPHDERKKRLEVRREPVMLNQGSSSSESSLSKTSSATSSHASRDFLSDANKGVESSNAHKTPSTTTTTTTDVSLFNTDLTTLPIDLVSSHIGDTYTVPQEVHYRFLPLIFALQGLSYEGSKSSIDSLSKMWQKKKSVVQSVILETLETLNAVSNDGNSTDTPPTKDTSSANRTDETMTDEKTPKNTGNKSRDSETKKIEYEPGKFQSQLVFERVMKDVLGARWAENWYEEIENTDPTETNSSAKSEVSTEPKRIEEFKSSGESKPGEKSRLPAETKSTDTKHAESMATESIETKETEPTRLQLRLGMLETIVGKMNGNFVDPLSSTNNGEDSSIMLERSTDTNVDTFYEYTCFVDPDLSFTEEEGCDGFIYVIYIIKYRNVHTSRHTRSGVESTINESSSWFNSWFDNWTTESDGSSFASSSTTTSKESTIVRKVPISVNAIIMIRGTGSFSECLIDLYGLSHTILDTAQMLTDEDTGNLCSLLKSSGNDVDINYADTTSSSTTNDIHLVSKKESGLMSSSVPGNLWDSLGLINRAAANPQATPTDSHPTDSGTSTTPGSSKSAHSDSLQNNNRNSSVDSNSNGERENSKKEGGKSEGFLELLEDGVVERALAETTLISLETTSSLIEENVFNLRGSSTTPSENVVQNPIANSKPTTLQHLEKLNGEQKKPSEDTPSKTMTTSRKHSNDDDIPKESIKEPIFDPWYDDYAEDLSTSTILDKEIGPACLYSGFSVRLKQIFLSHYAGDLSYGPGLKDSNGRTERFVDVIRRRLIGIQRVVEEFNRKFPEEGNPTIGEGNPTIGEGNTANNTINPKTFSSQSNDDIEQSNDDKKMDKKMVRISPEYYKPQFIPLEISKSNENKSNGNTNSTADRWYPSTENTEILPPLPENLEMSVLLGGHSLGGALSEVVSILIKGLQQKRVWPYSVQPNNDNKKRNPIILVSLASPPVGNFALAKRIWELNRSPDVVIYVYNRQDVLANPSRSSFMNKWFQLEHIVKDFGSWEVEKRRWDNKLKPYNYVDKPYFYLDVSAENDECVGDHDVNLGDGRSGNSNPEEGGFWSKMSTPHSLKNAISDLKNALSDWKKGLLMRCFKERHMLFSLHMGPSSNSNIPRMTLIPAALVANIFYQVYSEKGKVKSDPSSNGDHPLIDYAMRTYLSIILSHGDISEMDSDLQKQGMIVEGKTTSNISNSSGSDINETLLQQLQSFVHWIVGDLEVARDFLKEELGPAFPKLQQLSTSVLANLEIAIGSIGGIKNSVQGIRNSVEGIKGGVQGSAEVFKDSVETLKSLLESFKNVVEPLGKSMESLGKALEPLRKTVAGTPILGILEPWIEGLKKIFSKLTTNVANVTGNVSDSIKNGLENMTSTISKIKIDELKNLSNFGADLGSTMITNRGPPSLSSSLLEASLEQITDLFNTLIPLLGALAQPLVAPLKHLIEMPLKRLTALIRLEDVGDATTGMVTNVGEIGEEEVLVPLEHGLQPVINKLEPFIHELENLASVTKLEHRVGKDPVHASVQSSSVQSSSVDADKEPTTQTPSETETNNDKVKESVDANLVEQTEANVVEQTEANVVEETTQEGNRPEQSIEQGNTPEQLREQTTI